MRTNPTIILRLTAFPTRVHLDLLEPYCDLPNTKV